MYNGFLINERDDVVTVSEDIKVGSTVVYTAKNGECSIIATMPIPRYHKIAVRDIPAGQPVLKYGEVIGHATVDISKGDHVHVDNISDFVHEAEGKE